MERVHSCLVRLFILHLHGALLFCSFRFFFFFYFIFFFFHIGLYGKFYTSTRLPLCSLIETQGIERGRQDDGERERNYQSLRMHIHGLLGGLDPSSSRLRLGSAVGNGDSDRIRCNYNTICFGSSLLRPDGCVMCTMAQESDRRGWNCISGW